MEGKKAFITGVTGQDGSYLAELLLKKGYEVHGLVRRASSFNSKRIDHVYSDPHDAGPKLVLHYGDLNDGSRLSALLASIQPQEIYNLGAQSHVRVSFDEPEYTGATTALGTVRLLEAMRRSAPEAKFYQASSSEMFGAAPAPQGKQSQFEPRSPYAISKLYSHWTTKNYREAYGVFAVSGILFNHESPRRGETFLTRKVSRAVARIVAGRQDKLFLGNLDARRDWGYAPEYAVAMWKMLQLEKPEDFVIGTGSDFSVRDFVKMCFQHVGLEWEKYVRIDQRYLRPTEVDTLIADPSEAEDILGWRAGVLPTELAAIMVDHDLAALDGHIVDVPLGAVWAESSR
jgi:GDPmannose 4,6-dehydratase